jgi:copper chaperone CopZ
MGTTTRWTVAGMTCGHCVAAVSTELRALPGVEDVQVDLAPGGDSTVAVTSRDSLDEAAVRTALDKAGYELVGAAP